MKNIIGFLIQMLQRSILIISDDFDPDAFSEDLKSCKFEMLRVKINVELDSERIEGLMNGKIKLSRRGFRALWMYMASLQLTEYLTNIMAKYHFKFSPGKTTKAMINDMLEHFSVSESMQLIYSAIMKACARYLAGGITRNHAANTVITICKNYTTRAVNEGWTVKGFERDYDIEISTAESYFYTNILRIGEDGFRCSPGMMSDKLYDKLFLKEKTDDTQPE